MCIVFITLLKSAKPGDFKLVLASNRDEVFKRPGKAAHFWEENSDIFGGRDMTEGKQGGTWLAMSKKGKLGILLNVSGVADQRKLGRGFLVADFLKSSLSGREYLQEVMKRGDKYNHFHLVAADVGSESNILHYSNATDEAGITEVEDDGFAIGNSYLQTPPQKVLVGKSKFQEICQRLGKVDQKDELVGELLSLLKWEKKHYPDEVIDSLAHIPKDLKPEIGSIFVKTPNFTYGTRTHTVILVDWKNKVEFYEWTLKDPITPEHVEWCETHQEFVIE